MKEKIQTCEMCGFSFNKKVEHQCDPEVLEDRERQFKEWRRDEINALEADEMDIRDY